MTIKYAFACAAAGALAAASAAAAAPPVASITVAGLRGELGETLAAWRSAPAPAGFAGYQRVCRPEQWSPASPLVAASPRAVVACSWQKTLGKYVIRPSIRLQPGGQDVRRVTWYFQAGRLVAVAADTTTDAYDAVTRSLAKTYGPVATTVRRTAATRDGPLPQVLMAWRGQGSLAAVTDPAPPRWGLRLVLAQAALADSRTAAVKAPDRS